MADPTDYEPSYSFTNFQNNDPSSPLPAVQLDNELENVAAAVSQLVTAIKDVRRSDGALKNRIVTFDSLALELQLTFDPTNGQLVAAAVAGAQASAVAALASQIAAANSAAAALTQATAAAASAATVNLSLYLAKANNLAGLGSQSTSRSNLGLGTAATLNYGVDPGNVVLLDANSKIAGYDGSQLTGIDVLPVGTTIWVNGTSAPAGTVKENGALVSRITFARLYAFAAASGNIVSEASWSGGNTGAFSTGDLSTTFRIPDARGEFVRGYDDSRGVDSGRVLGAHQADTLKDHTHAYNEPASKVTGAIVNAGASAFFWTGSAGATGVSGSPSTGAASETRPRNNAKLACIKY